jgi:hypothetical protein
MHVAHWALVLALITFLSIGVFGFAWFWFGFIATIPMGLHSLHRFFVVFVVVLVSFFVASYLLTP